MHLAFNEDQTMFDGVLKQMLAAPEAEFRTMPGWGRFEYGAALDKMLEENGFYDAAGEETLGTIMAASLVYEVAQMPVAVECAASSLLRPFLGDDLPRPLAVTTAPKGLIRFLPQSRAIVSIADDRIQLADIPEDSGAVVSVQSLYAYPVGKLDRSALTWRDVDVDPARIMALWRVAVAAELIGSLKGGLESVLTYVRERAQFGKPLGAFQAVQHRLATASVQIEGAQWQMLRAAQHLDSQNPALALGTAQGIATRIGYDLHQFMGAMGLTLEHPIHRWTYRARLLRTELGGQSGAMRAYADQRWGSV